MTTTLLNLVQGGQVRVDLSALCSYQAINPRESAINVSGMCYHVKLSVEELDQLVGAAPPTKTQDEETRIEPAKVEQPTARDNVPNIKFRNRK